MKMGCHPLRQRSPTFLAPGTDFVEDNFSTDGEGEGNSSGSNVSKGERRGAADEASMACPLLTSCCTTGTGLQPRGWGPLL